MGACARCVRASASASNRARCPGLPPLRSVGEAKEEIPAFTQAPPAPEPGEIRLPLVFENGKATVGGMPVGPAPRLD